MTPIIRTEPDDDPNAGWEDGHSRVEGGLCCDVCGALVPQMPDATARHREWHAELETATGKRSKPGTITSEDVPKRR